MRLIPALLASIFAIATGLRLAAASTGDQGPGAAVAAIRHDLPRLLAASLQDFHLTPTVDWVVADNRNAVAMWHAEQNRGVVALRRRAGRWLWRGAAVTTAGDIGVWTPMSTPGNRITLCFHHPLNPGPPPAHELFEQGYIDKQLADQLSGRLEAVPPFSNKEPVPIVLCDPDTRYIDSKSEAYDATLFHKQDVGWKWFVLSGHTPGDRQRVAIAGADPYYLFTLGVETFPDSESPPVKLNFASGSTFEVWFPFVLPKGKNYTLTLNDVVPRISELSGTLENNVVRFVLPPFTLQTRVPAQGEIDGTSY